MSPLAVLTKLATMLRIVPAVQLVFAKFAALLRSDKGNDKPPISKFLGEAPGVASNTVDHHVAILKSTGDIVIAVPESNDQSEREKLIRRRWTETGIKMWNPNVHGEGHAALNIQGRVELLPVKPGETFLVAGAASASQSKSGSYSCSAAVGPRHSDHNTNAVCDLSLPASANLSSFVIFELQNFT